MAASLRHLALVPILVAALSIASGAFAGGEPPTAAGGCPTGAVCDHALGIALVPSPGWQLVPPGHFPPHVLSWFVQPPLGLDYNIRLLIGPDGITTDHNDGRAANAAAAKLISGYRGVHIDMHRVHYAGTSGVLMRGLPGGSGTSAAFIILAHRGALYSIIAPGSTLGFDQDEALASLRFIPRSGPFPASNPPAPRGRPSHRTIKGGVFHRQSLVLTPTNGIRHGTQTLSLVFGAEPGWRVTYFIRCTGARGRLVVGIVDLHGRLHDRIVHRSGPASQVQQVEGFGGAFRLRVESSCLTWRVTARGVTS
ncbi:MAG: hypothetical protein ACRDFX_10340 [Chloroflexota bacterium]